MWSLIHTTLSLTLDEETTESKLVERKHAPQHQASRQTEVGGILFSFFHISSSDPA